MKIARFIIFWELLAFACACTAPLRVFAEQQKVHLAAPTGNYASHIQTCLAPPSTNTVPLFTLSLETNVTYFAESAGQRPTHGIDGTGLYWYRDTSRGTWQWDAASQQFMLTPKDSKGFTFYLGCLPVDQVNTNRLIWGSSYLERQKIHD